MSGVECPYCEAEFEVCQDDGYATDENITYEQECPECEKIFALTVSLHFYFEGRKADCMNDGPHRFREEKSPSAWDVGMPRCMDCDNRILVDEKANNEAIDAWRKGIGH